MALRQREYEFKTWYAYTDRCFRCRLGRAAGNWMVGRIERMRALVDAENPVVAFKIASVFLYQFRIEQRFCLNNWHLFFFENEMNRRSWEIGVHQLIYTGLA